MRKFTPAALYARALDIRFGDDIADMIVHRNLMRLKER